MARTGEGGEAGDGGGTDGPLQQSNRSRNSVDDSLSDLMVRMPRLNSQASEKIITFFGAEKAQPSTSFVAENNDIRQCIFN